MRRTLRPAALAALAAASCQACSGPAPPDPSLPTAAPVVEVTMREHRFELVPPSSAGHVVFRFVNAGQVVHRPALVALPDDMPSIDVQLRGTERRLLDPLAGVYDRLPGATGTFAVDLRPNQRYALICFALDGDGSPHRTQGMATEFRPEAPPAPVRPGANWGRGT